ncbi:MAG: thrombospondin type 3 repeat-containing protein [Gammaproteobacteria bacterium]|nr:thrombospondin type 3 repeat-containing protein [Gammaproteobacteria bacterium]
MFQSLAKRLSVAAALALTASAASAANAPIDVTNPVNGLTGIFSVTFDGGTIPCGGGSSAYCTFFAGDPTPTRGVSHTLNPSRVINAVPGGIGPGSTAVPIGPAPASGSFLDLTLGGGNTTLTLGVSTITFGDVDICATSSAAGAGGAALNYCENLNVHAGGAPVGNAGIVFSPTGPVNGGAFTPVGGGSTGDNVPVDANGKAVFMVQNAGGIVVDFSQFSQVVTSCTGVTCAAITFDVLNLDVVRYVLEIDYDPGFTTFTGRFIGQTGNKSMVFATLNSAGTDQDGDGILDTADNCPVHANADQANTDGDARGNVCDNCLLIANTVAGTVPNAQGVFLKSQFDIDSDGFGNRCDGDVSNSSPVSGQVNTTDYSILRSVINKFDSFSFNAARSDLDASGTVNTTDYSIFRTLINKVPGPSGYACATNLPLTIPCPAAPSP